MTYMTRSWMLLKHLAQKDLNAGFAKYLRDRARPSQIAYVRIMTRHKGNPSGIEHRHASGQERWAFVLPDVGGEGMRIQFFDLQGFSRHQCFRTLMEATDEMVMQGYWIEDSGVLDRISITAVWAEGIARLETISGASSPRVAA